jgi:2-hydroxymuconate-semialdehyde hydrolase
MSEWVAAKGFRGSGGRIAYVDRGSGPAVVLLHGFPTSSVLWRDVGPALADSFRVVAPDLLGYGRSDQPEDAPLHPRAQATYVRELLADLGIERFAAVGHDLGGAVAQLLALDGGVDALCLLDAAAFDAWPIEGVRMLQGATPEQEEREFVGSIIDLTFDLGVERKEVVTQELLSAFREPFTADAAAAHAFFRAARAIDGVGLAGREAELAALDLPTLLVWGEDDPFLGAELADRLAATLARPAQVLLPGRSHFTPLEAAEDVTPLLSQFLGTHLLGRSHAHGPEHAHGSGPVPVTLERRGPA